MNELKIPPLHICVSKSLEEYFKNLEDEISNDVYQMVMDEVEPALLRVVMQHSKQNQTKAAKILGINRSTLRKKLNLYGKAIYQTER